MLAEAQENLKYSEKGGHHTSALPAAGTFLKHFSIYMVGRGQRRGGERDATVRDLLAKR